MTLPDPGLNAFRVIEMPLITYQGGNLLVFLEIYPANGTLSGQLAGPMLSTVEFDTI